VLSCVADGACKVWKVSVDCGSQQLTAGTLSGKPACVCKPAQQALYVDPAPPAAAQPLGTPTGAQSPPACRLPTITAALATAGATTGGASTITRVVVVHEGTAAVHLGQATGEAFPLAVPSGVTVMGGTATVLDPGHYFLDVKGLASAGPAVTLANGAKLAGFTVDASGAAGTDNGGANVTAVVACGGVAAQTAAIDQVVIDSQAGQTGVSITGACALTMTASGIYQAGIGVDVSRTASGAQDTASLTASNMAINTQAPSGIGIRVGSGPDGGARSSVITNDAIINTPGSGVLVAGGTAQLTNGTITIATAATGAQSRGLVVSGGAATLNGVGIMVTGVSAPPNAIAAELTGGTTTLAGLVVSGGPNVTGVQISGAAIVTLTGTAAAGTKLGTTLAATSTDPSDGVVVLAGASQARLTLHGNVSVGGFHNGLTLNDGTLLVDAGSAGEAALVAGNRNDGCEILQQTAGTTATLTGVAVRDNGGKGVIVRSTVPVSMTSVTVSGNAGDGIDLQRTQAATRLNMSQFTLSGSTITANGGRGVALSGQGVGAAAAALGGKVAAALNGNTISTNSGVGVYVTEGADAADGDDVTELWFQQNDVGANMTSASASSPLAGGVLFTTSDATTRVLLRSFLGNKVHGNGHSQIGFTLAQDDGAAWNLTASTSGATSLCEDASMPNAAYCYDGFPGDYGIAVMPPTIPLQAKGIHLGAAPAVSGRDYSPGIPTGEITSVCAPLSCP
jgi:hypothetical protein